MRQHNKVVLAIGMLLLIAGLAAAQEEESWKMDVYLGGRLGATVDFAPYDFGGNTNMRLKPNILLGYNAWVVELNDQMAVGPIVRFGIAFPQKVGISYEAQDAYYKYTSNFLPNAVLSDLEDDTMKMLGDEIEPPILLNLDGLIGGGFKFNFTDSLGLAAKLGFAINYETATLKWDNSLGGKTTFTAGYVMMGIGLDLAVQFVIPIDMGKMQLYAEGGVNLSYYFGGFSSFDLTIKEKVTVLVENIDPNTGQPNGTFREETKEQDAMDPIGGQGQTVARSFLSMGLPYLAIGIRF